MLENETKLKLLTEMLQHVPFEGWTDNTMYQAAKNIELSNVSLAVLFPHGISDIIDFFMAELDQQMLAMLESTPLTDMKIREKIATAVKIRIEQGNPYRNAIYRAMARYALPYHAPRAMKTLWKTVDAIWYAIGDTSTDYNYYTKRLMLSGVYSTTLIFWLDDTSENYSETWQFLDRRIANVMQIGKIPTTIKNQFKRKN